MLSLDGAFVHEEHYEARRNKRHRSDDEDRDEYVRASETGDSNVESHKQIQLQAVIRLLDERLEGCLCTMVT